MNQNAIKSHSSANAISMMAFAAIIGILGGFGTIIFRKLIAILHNLFFSARLSDTYNETLHTASSIWGIGIILLPIIGGLLVIWILEKYASDQRGLSVPEIVYAIFFKDGKIQPITALAKTFASAITIATGGSVGREGPVFQIGATLGSLISDVITISTEQRKLLITAGVAATTATIFHAPLSGIIFAVELLLMPITAFGIFLIIISTILAISIEYLFNNLDPIFTIQYTNHLIQDITFSSLILFVLFSILAGITSIIFIHGTYWLEDLFNYYIKNAYLRHMIGMSFVGCLIYLIFASFGHYYIEGIGFATIQDCLRNEISNPKLLLILIVAKLLVTSLTLGTGASGGIFSPSLFIGATLGTAFGVIINNMFPALNINPILFTIIGMASMLGSTTGALITSILLTCEMTRSGDIIFSVIITVLTAYGVRRIFSAENIYSLKLRRRGIDLPHRYYK